MLWAQTMLIGRLFKPLEYRETPIFIAIAISRIWKHNPSKVGQISIHCTIPKTMLFLLVLWPYKLFNFGCWRVFLLGGCSYHTHNLGHIGNDWHFAKPTHPSPCQWMRPIHHGQLLLHPRQWMWQIHQWPVATTPSPMQYTPWPVTTKPSTGNTTYTSWPVNATYTPWPVPNTPSIVNAIYTPWPVTTTPLSHLPMPQPMNAIYDHGQSLLHPCCTHWKLYFKPYGVMSPWLQCSLYHRWQLQWHLP